MINLIIVPHAVQRTAESVLKEIFPCLVACGLVEDNMDAYTMQISGERSYIAGNHDLLEFKDIRRYCSNTLINNHSALAIPNHYDNDHGYSMACSFAKIIKLIRLH